MNCIDLSVLWFQQPPSKRRSWVILELVPGEAHIYLSKEAPPDVAEIYAAEELWHVLQYCQGFSNVVTQPRYREWQPVATALSSLLLDPLAYEAMPSFGLDLEPFFLEVSKETDLEDIRLMMRDFERHPRVELRMYWGALLIPAGKMMELPPPFLEKVGALYRSEFPDLWKAAQALVAAIHDHGFDTPERQSNLLWWILEENQLTEYLTIHHR